jgi:hypothetical protein
VVLVLTAVVASLFYYRTTTNYSPTYVEEATVSVEIVNGGSYANKNTAEQMGLVFPYILTSGALSDVIAQDLGLLYVDYSAGKFPLSLRVARHVAGCAAFIQAYNDSLENDDRAIIIGNVPDYAEMVETDDLGLYLR